MVLLPAASTSSPTITGAVLAIEPVKPKLLDLPARELLEKFGAGRHQPGSGSAAALTGLMSCKLLLTVLSLCRARSSKVERIRNALPSLVKFESQIISEIEPFLLASVQTDAEQFHKVIIARKLRDRATDDAAKKRFEQSALEELVAATEIPMAIAEHCLVLAEKGLEVFDKGFLAARGDAGVAVSTAVAAALGALSVVFLNLGYFKSPELLHQTRDMRTQADRLFDRVRGLQIAAFGRVQRLQKEATVSQQIPLL